MNQTSILEIPYDGSLVMLSSLTPFKEPQNNKSRNIHYYHI